MSKINATDYEGRSRDPSWETELRELLSEQPEDVRLSFLLELVNYQPAVALQLMNKTLKSRSSFTTILDYAVMTSDASSIKYWLDSVVPRLGYRRSIARLEGLLATEPNGVEKAAYWMPRLGKSDKETEILKEFQHKLTEATSRRKAVAN